MSIVKYILFALLLLGLWVTEPLWDEKQYNKTTSPLNKHITEQGKARTELLATEANTFIITNGIAHK